MLIRLIAYSTNPNTRAEMERKWRSPDGKRYLERKIREILSESFHSPTDDIDVTILSVDAFREGG